MGYNKENRKRYSAKYYQENKSRFQERDFNRRQFECEKYLLYSSKSRAKRAGIEWNLSLEDIVIPVYCPYLGVALTRIVGSGRDSSRIDTNPSLDRIDPTKGYVPGNVQVISLLANRMKQNATTEQLITFAQNVLRLYV